MTVRRVRFTETARDHVSLERTWWYQAGVQKLNSAIEFYGKERKHRRVAPTLWG